MQGYQRQPFTIVKVTTTNSVAEAIEVPEHQPFSLSVFMQERDSVRKQVVMAS